MNSKNDIITSGKYGAFLEIKRNLYKQGLNCNDIEYYKVFLSESDIIQCQRIYDNNRKRKKKNADDLIRWCFAKNCIPVYKDYKLIFGTLDFNDKALATTTKATRRRVVARYIKQFADNYVANIDYGDKNGREHYHFIAFAKNKFDIHKWNYGGGKFLNVPINKKDIRKVKSYILKMNNHTYKGSTQLERVLKDKNNILDKLIDLLFINEYQVYKLKFNKD